MHLCGTVQKPAGKVPSGPWQQRLQVVRQLCKSMPIVALSAVKNKITITSEERLGCLRCVGANHPKHPWLGLRWLALHPLLALGLPTLYHKSVCPSFAPMISNWCV